MCVTYRKDIDNSASDSQQCFVLLKIILIITTVVPFAHGKLSNINRKFQKASACSQISVLEVLYDLALNPKDV